jgi:hypothetical protein
VEGGRSGSGEVLRRSAVRRGRCWRRCVVRLRMAVDKGFFCKEIGIGTLV